MKSINQSKKEIRANLFKVIGELPSYIIPREYILDKFPKKYSTKKAKDKLYNAMYGRGTDEFATKELEKLLKSL